MKRLTVNDIIATIDKCGCECHHGFAMHFMACCEFTYVKRKDAAKYLESVQKDLKGEQQ